MNDELTVREAAEYKGMSLQAVHRAIKEGRLAARVHLPPGSAQATWRIRREDLDAWQPVMDPHEKGKLGGRPRRSEGEE